MADDHLALLLKPSHHLPLSTRKDLGDTLVPLDAPEKLTIGERLPASVSFPLCVTDTRAPLLVTLFPSSPFIQISRFCSILQNSHLLLLSSKIGETNLVIFSEMASLY